MKILQAIPYFVQERGGDVAVCASLSDYLIKLGNGVTILTTDIDKEKTKTETDEKVKVVRIKNKGIDNLLPYSKSTSKWLESNTGEYEIVHLHTYWSQQVITVGSFCKRMNIPYIVQAHGSVFPNGKEFRKKIFDELWGKRILRNAASVIALNETEIREYESRGVDRSRIKKIGNGINYENIKRTLEQKIKGQFKNKFNIPTDEQIITYIGRLHHDKRLDILIDSFAIVLQRQKDVRLVIVGPDFGAKEKIIHQIKNLGIQEHVLVLGFIPKEEKFDLLIDSDVFVTPCFHGFPITFLEAASSGVPIITTKLGDELDWLDKQVGFATSPDPGSLAEGILTILNNPQIKSNFSINGPALVEKEFSQEIISRKIFQLYSEIIDHK